MELTLRTLQKLQRDTGFNPDLLEKTFYVAKILSGIFKDKRLEADFALKGGTALNFIYLALPRLSVDLDLNFIGSLEKEGMLSKRKDMPEKIAALAGSMGYRMTKRPGSYIMERYALRYRRLSGLPDSGRLEFNFLDRVPFIGIVRRTFDSIFEFEKFKVNTYTIEEIAAMKTKAIVERLYARDIFDIFGISKLKLNENILKKLMILYILMAGKEPDVEDIISRVKRYDGKEMMRSVGPFMAKGHEKGLNPMRIKEAVSYFYRRVFVLNDSEKQFIESVKSGKIDLNILFEKENFNPQADKHPGLVWALGLG
ncbi:nucleotidyl transferase AbiEii/AbiGii toxin family protein [bacterium]|nr:nucleotidyl transferase AbiEii/AbiGii toxin family protein [bacterium]